MLLFFAEMKCLSIIPSSYAWVSDTRRLPFALDESLEKVSIQRSTVRP
jgi:hypothetical protein